MRWLVLSDLHSNLEAVTAVLDDARREGFDRSAILGDIVGYGASPNEVIALLRELEPAAAIRGNHDRAASGTEAPDAFNQAATEAILWTRRALDAESRRWLSSLPEGPVEAGGFLIAHGSPLDEDDYILTPRDAVEVFDTLEFELCFFGHSHLASEFVATGQSVGMSWLQGPAETVLLGEGTRHLINPGSIGQPRDNDPRAAYALYDAARRHVTIRRVAYDTEAAARRIFEAGLPEILGRRLAMGV